MLMFTICFVIASCATALSTTSCYSSATPSQSETPSQSFAAKAAVQKSVSKLVAHADAVLKKCDPSIVAAIFPSDAETLRPVKIFNDLPVVLYVDFLK
jgi:heme A synthase